MKQMYCLARGIAVIAVVYFLPASCDKKEDFSKKEISIDRTELTFSKEDSENKEFNVSCDGEWHIEADSLSMYYGVNMANVRDFTITPVSGKGNATVTVSLKNERPEITESYTVELNIIGKDSQTTLTLKAVAK
ncbi:MAG: hypothetical protein LBB73_00380 [Dysgonamonadaceae bacterium]|jgi:hypothetical protein|nr:hypothetical protein [Dysgonamonadaceae bacterium]